ncbi:MAG: SDR family oxidoreductase [Eubacteriales bacterium]|nr:SDR family oxidoreductase [Eubacteriales bacterium]
MKALITGASSGIGREMAKELASRGWDLIIVARRTAKLEQLKAELTSVNVKCISCDVSKEEECLRLYEETKDDNIDMLINNAGFGAFGYFDEVPLERDLSLVDTNIRAVHILTKLYLRDFVKRDSGYILNTGSIAGFMIGPLLSSYYSSKHYVVTLTEAIYEELRRKKSNVKVSVLCPGPVDTEFNDVAKVKFAIKGHTAEYVAKYAVKKALKGKLLIIPGVLTRLGIFGARFLPRKLLSRLLYRVQKLKM